jgi:hypothetical protein
MDVDGTAIENVGKPDPTKSATATPNYVGDSDDSSETIEPRSSIEDQQASIMAEDNGEEDKKEDVDKAMHPKMENAEHDEKEDDNGEMKKADKEEDKEEEIEEAMGLKKQLANLQKQIEALDISKAVKEESENRLRKMGFKEENGLQRPQLSNTVFGADETPIKKAQTVNDVVDQLTNLSYKELRKMQEFKRQGMVEGLPDEIANL